MPRYDTPVTAGVTAARRLAETMRADLNPHIGGVAWWAGYKMSPDQRAWLSHYAVGCPDAVAHNLAEAAAHLALYRDLVQEEDLFTASRHRIAFAGNGNPDLVNRTDAEALRWALLGAELTAFFRATGSVLDTLAATVIGVGALKTDMVKASWGALQLASDDPAYPRISDLRRILADRSTSGGHAQDQILRAVHGAVQAAGPAGWNTWTNQMRNSLIHRARAVTYTVQVEQGDPDAGYIRPLGRRPDLTDGQATSKSSELPDIILTEDGVVTLCGVLAWWYKPSPSNAACCGYIDGPIRQCSNSPAATGNPPKTPPPASTTTLRARSLRQYLQRGRCACIRTTNDAWPRSTHRSISGSPSPASTCHHNHRESKQSAVLRHPKGKVG